MNKKDHQYIQLEFDNNYRKLFVTCLAEPDEPLPNMKPRPVGAGFVPMQITKTSDGYSVISPTAGYCVSRILNAITNHIKEWTNEAT